PSRKANQSAPAKPQNQTLRICQGVPIPDGYVIIAYMTSSACEHGAYLLKKQNDYESSLAVNSEEKKAEPVTNAKSSGTALSTRGSAQVKKPGTSARTSNQPSTGTQTAGNSVSSATVTRARRVGSPTAGTAPATQSQAATQGQEMTQSQAGTQTPDGPPTLI